MKYAKYSVAAIAVLVVVLLSGTAYAFVYPSITNSGNEVPVEQGDVVVLAEFELLTELGATLENGQLYQLGGDQVKYTTVKYPSNETRYEIEKTQVGWAKLKISTVDNVDVKIRITTELTQESDRVTFEIDLLDADELKLTPDAAGVYTITPALYKGAFLSFTVYVNAAVFTTPPTGFSYSLTVEQV